MSYLTPLELARVWSIRPDLFSTLTHHMALFEQRSGGRRTQIPANAGVRTTATQRAIYADSLAADGKSFKPGYRAAPPGSSAHELGAAYDLQIVGARADDPGYELLAQIGEELGLVAGKHFRSGPPDPFHFETNETPEVRRRLWNETVRRRLRRALVAGGIVTAIGISLWLGWRSLKRNARADDAP